MYCADRSVLCCSVLTAPTDTENLQLTFIIAGCIVVVLIAVLIGVSRKRFPDSKPMAFVMFILNTVSFLSALVFIESIFVSSDNTLMTYFWVAAAALVFSVIVNTIVVSRLIYSEMTNSGVAHWLQSAGGAMAGLSVVTLFCTLRAGMPLPLRVCSVTDCSMCTLMMTCSLTAMFKLGSFDLVHSRLFYVPALSAPISPESIRHATVTGLFTTLGCDIPFVVIQILSSRYLNKWTTTVALSFALSCLSITVSIIQRILTFCLEMAQRKTKANRAVIKHAKQQAYSARMGETGGAGGADNTTNIEMPAAGAGEPPKSPSINAFVGSETGGAGVVTGRSARNTSGPSSPPPAKPSVWIGGSVGGSAGAAAPPELPAAQPLPVSDA